MVIASFSKRERLFHMRARVSSIGRLVMKDIRCMVLSVWDAVTRINQSH